MTVPEAFALAHQHHQAGRLAEADAIYRQILAVEPRHVDALHLLGVIALQSGRHEVAVELIRQAIALAPAVPAFRSNLGVALQELGRTEEAAAAFRSSIELDFNQVEAHCNLGNLLHDQGQLDEAVASYRRALQLKPDYEVAHNNLGIALRGQGRLVEAVASYGRALQLNPGYAEAHNNLGNALRDQGRLDEALASCARALQLKPDYAEAHNNLGNVLRDQGRLEEALAAYRRALQLQPAYAMAHNNLGNVLKDQGRLDEAVAAYRHALHLQPDYAEVSNNLGNALSNQGRLDEAVAAYRRALQLKPDYADAHSNLGNALKDRGELEEALAAYRRALDLKPDLIEAHSNMIFTLDLLETTTPAQQQEERRRWYTQHGQRFAAQIAPHENAPDPDRRVRVGYVSADFRRHSAYPAFGPVICGHDPAEFEVFCYSGVMSEDDVTARLRGAAQTWRSTLGITDDALAEQIRRDCIDILVDLSGHSAGNRLLVFARKPAPVQVTAWGHATGTGVQTMDYFFADPVYVPAEQRGLFAEEVIDLPCFLCYEPPEYLPEITVLPASEGNPLTYGCVNRLEKITDRAIALWGRVLQGSPGARLLLKDKGFGDAGVRQAFLGRLLRFGGIEESRVLTFGATPHAEHLKIFHQIDIGLDPFPQCGGASTGEALWMGVPVVTLQGATVSSRTSAAILSVIGMRDWIAQSDDEYVRIGVEAGRDLARVAKLRKELRTLLAASPYGDVGCYTHAVEQAYRQMWRAWCARQCSNPLL